jgi:hypothetical protein
LKQAVRTKARFLNKLPANQESFLLSFLSRNPEHIVSVSAKSYA